MELTACSVAVHRKDSAYSEPIRAAAHFHVSWPTDTQYMTDENKVRNSADMYSIQFIEENRLTILCVINNATGQLR